MSSLHLRDLTVERGGRAVVRDVSVEIEAGQVTALLGPNGAGKSTLVLAVGGVLRPRSGTVLLDGEDITGRRPERIRQAGVAIVPEGRRLLPDLTVEDNLRVASYALTRDQAQAGRDRVLELFPQLGQRLTAAARTLSGGEQQMVVLAQALITQPRYLLIDELSLGLAPVVVSRLIPVIAAVAESASPAWPASCASSPSCSAPPTSSAAAPPPTPPLPSAAGRIPNGPANPSPAGLRHPNHKPQPHLWSVELHWFAPGKPFDST